MIEATDEAWRSHLGSDAEPLGVLWGKSDAGGRPNLLLQHLFDTMAVAELIWDRFLAPVTRRGLDDVAAFGEGRRLYIWLCGLHDIGKATPAFQAKDVALAARVRATGLDWPNPPLTPSESRTWRHEKASALILRETLAGVWQDAGIVSQIDWLWPLLAGHHGRIPTLGETSLSQREKRRRRRLHGVEGWCEIQRTLVEIVTVAAGYPDLTAARPTGRPTKTNQLALAGFVVMADWVASDEYRFPGVDTLSDVGQGGARRRAERAWEFLGLRRGWGDLPVVTGDLVERRFGRPARPLQKAVLKAAHGLPGPGLLVIEAPMGEGKTEAALGAAEVLAARFGADGIFVAMPTQATADPMFTRTRLWLDTLDPSAPIALVHGKRMFNEEWRRLVDRRTSPSAPGPYDDDCDGKTSEPDEYGLVDGPPSAYVGVAEDAGGGDGQGDEGQGTAPSEWLLGRHRSLLSPNGVGTVDQVLFAGTRTRFVMLRTAGLVGKVVVLDEVHAADIYMTQFLGEVLTWLGTAGVPMVLLSATLAPSQRHHLVRSYLRGQVGDPHLDVAIDDSLPGYPSVLAAWSEKGEARIDVQTAASWRKDQTVTVSVAEETTNPDETLLGVLKERLQAGGCALVLRNTVARAQASYRALSLTYGDDVVLLHARYGAAERADRTEDVLDRLGPNATNRPRRMIVVATQVAEQSFDVDVDMLVTDLAPVDLVLQRIGRLHRHDRPAHERPQPLRHPHVIVTGLRLDGPSPKFPGGSEAVYGRHNLLRATALVLRAGQQPWAVPGEVPGLVAAAYGEDDLIPEAWRADAEAARARWDEEQRMRREKAHQFLLAAPGHQTATTLEGLHHLGVTAKDGESHVRVRDGEESEEVVLVRRDDQGYCALDGVRLGPNADAGPDHLLSVLGGTVRLPAHPVDLSSLARRLGTLPAWRDHPWLGRAHVVVLFEGLGELGPYCLRYDECGLTVEKRA